MNEETIEKLKKIESEILFIDVSKGDYLNKKAKRKALELLRELIPKSSN